MRDVIKWHRRKKGNLKTLCLFISDGAIGATGPNYKGDVRADIKNCVCESQDEVFWSFVGAGGGNYGALEELDNLPGRRRDNSYFFAVDRIDSMGDERLYGKVLTQFGPWLRSF